MSLGIKSIWRTGPRSIGTFGTFPQRALALHVRESTSSFSTSHSHNNHEIAQSSVSDPYDRYQTSNEPNSDLQNRVEVIQTKHSRNVFLRNAFRETTPAIRERVERKRNSPYVPTARHYPSLEAARSSQSHSNRVARVQVGIDAIWENFDQRVPDWMETFNLLKRMTPKRTDAPNMAAVRVVLPSTWDFPVKNKRIEFLDTATGLATKLRVTANYKIPNYKIPSALVLRGESSVLTKAADELIKVCPDVEIFKLGEVATFDYMAKRLWPSIDNAADGGLSLPPRNRDSIWVHKEVQTYWIDKPYEQTPKPSIWTKESFETYITALVCGRLRSHLALKYYRQPREDGKLIDTDGIRVQLILNAFEDPSARECITPSVLKLALAFMAQKGGHRASADRLFTLAEKWGLPMDTEMFNIILDGYVSKRDAAFFHRVLQKMEMRYFYPNARTWLHFLKLVQRDNERRQVIVAMYEIGLFEDPATRRGIAQTMASHDSYAAFKAGKTLDHFMADQAMRYGEDWFTSGAMNPILKEFLRFYGNSAISSESFQTLMKRPFEDGRALDISTFHAILETCLENKDWTTALWTLSHMHDQSCEPNHRTYSLLTSLAIITGAPCTLGVIFFYGLLERKLREPSRKVMQAVLLRRLLSKSPFRMFSRKTASLLKEKKISKEASAVAGVEWAVLSSLDGYKPVKSLGVALDTTWRTMDLPSIRKAKQRASKDNDSSKDSTKHDYAIKLRDGRNQRPPVTVHLDTAFDPDSMIRKRVATQTSTSDIANPAAKLEI